MSYQIRSLDKRSNIEYVYDGIAKCYAHQDSYREYEKYRRRGRASYAEN